jgi:hypothetical protein
LNQIGEQRPQLKIRHDHWVPYCILTGLKNRTVADDIIQKCVTIHKQPMGYYRLPLKNTENQNTQFPGWTISESIKSTTNALCNAIQEDSIKSLLENEKISLYWERDEFRFLIEKDKQDWPEFIVHEKLQLLRNRYPVVPGFDNKTRSDIFIEEVPETQVPNSYKDFMKKPQLWKIRNEVPKEGQVHRYGSKFGKRFPIMKKTASTSKYRKDQ